MRGTAQVVNIDLVQLAIRLKAVSSTFHEITFQHVHHEHNLVADQLSKLAVYDSEDHLCGEI